MKNVDYDNIRSVKNIYGKNLGLYQSPYDSRDYKFKDLIPVGAVKIPEEYESKLPPFVYDQGSSSECCACSLSSIRYMQEQVNEEDPIQEPFAPSFTYANRLPGEDFEGMYMKSACKKAREGSVPWSKFPGFYSYNICKKKFNENKTELLRLAKPFAIDSYYTCTSREQIQTAIMTTQAVIIGINIFDCFYTPNKENIIDYNPNKHFRSQGGHAVVAYGWKSTPNGFYWKILNSWSASYGKKGTILLPESYPWVDPAAYAMVDGDTKVKWSDYNINKSN